MNAFLTSIIALQVLSALTIIGLVLLQHGKGADMGAAFGSGASGSLFGATGSSNFLSKSTGVAAAIFFAATLALAFLGNKHTTVSGGVMENLPAPSAPAAAGAIPSASSGKAASAPAATTDARPAASAPADTAGQSNQIPK
jgi:preprotein translocase subunit SecG